MSKNDPAFPTEEAGFDATTGNMVNFKSSRGLTKREYFAGLAMQAFIGEGIGAVYEQCAIACVHYADALLAELEKQP